MALLDWLRSAHSAASLRSSGGSRSTCAQSASTTSAAARSAAPVTSRRQRPSRHSSQRRSSRRVAEAAGVHGDEPVRVAEVGVLVAEQVAVLLGER